MSLTSQSPPRAIQNGLFSKTPRFLLPIPALILSKPELERNTQLLLEDVKRLGIEFRPHVETLKVQFLYSLGYSDPKPGVVVDRPQWSVVWMSREHGILGWVESDQTRRLVEKIGSKSGDG
ncbi:hypothetical protein N7501_001244 [Penicillium viridicatum]|nr:hypothetical protein N7501_001244 [Penicillium viridicatum]